MTFIVSVCQRFTLRSDRDSNSGNGFAVYTLSRRASSATRAPLQDVFVAVGLLFVSMLSDCVGEQL